MTTDKRVAAVCDCAGDYGPFGKHAAWCATRPATPAVPQYEDAAAPERHSVVATPEDDLPGMLALANAVAAGNWPHTMDAKVWAEEFCRRFHVMERDAPYYYDEEAVSTMLSWFANAIMAGYDTAQYRAARSAPVVPTGAAATPQGETCGECKGSGCACRSSPPCGCCIICGGSGREGISA